jgi:glycosyltransferase involved in cell wall biosynthesis/GT2 family glycosyltransferase
MKFSIVINTLNRGAWLRDAIHGLKGLNHPSFEVVVVNGPSTDDSQAIIEEWSGRIKIVRCGEPNLSMSRNVGIEAASGDIVAFIDDDAVPDPEWLNQLEQHYANPKIGGVGGYTIDNTGTRFQVRKTICDRFGNARSVSDFFDERQLCFPGTPFYPSLLGTNSSFRRSALLGIGGFDHVFAYLLDETDVCLRLIDAGHHVIYEPNALVYHQFAPSGLRSHKRLPKTLFPSVVSKSYFIQTHGWQEELRSNLAGETARQLADYRLELITANKWMHDSREISEHHWVSLDQDVTWGISKGTVLAQANKGGQGDLDHEKAGNPEPFLPFADRQGMRIALVSQSFPPDNEAGVARWTAMMAQGLASRGHTVHVIAYAAEQPSTRFEKGYWVHRIRPDHELGRSVMSAYDLPPNVASWTAAVALKVDALRQSGLDVASFPIWDVEGVALSTLDDVATVMSLHTSYAMALPFKPEWNLRPLYRHHMVDKMIRQEAKLIASMPVILANSEAIVADLTQAYGVPFAERATIVPHGTFDPFEAKPERKAFRSATAPCKVAFVGRFEPRKGIDIAVAAFGALHAAHPELEFHFVGDSLNPVATALFAANGGSELLSSPRVRFHGQVSREELDDLYSTVDIVFMPSRYESFGLVAIEAMAAGAVVVAAKAGGLQEVVTDGKSGCLVVLDGNEGKTAARIIGDLVKDKKRRAAMGKAARQHFEDAYQVDLMAARAEEVYARAVALKTEERRNVA